VPIGGGAVHIGQTDAVQADLGFRSRRAGRRKRIGYDIAVYDALQEGRDGLGRVLEQIGELVKKAERQKYMHWVFAASWDSSDWLTKCQITEFLRKALAPFMPKAILDKPIAQFAEDWQYFLFLYLDSPSLLGHLADGKPLFSNL
jgi:ribosomal protein S16